LREEQLFWSIPTMFAGLERLDETFMRGRSTIALVVLEQLVTVAKITVEFQIPRIWLDKPSEEGDGCKALGTGAFKT